MKVSAAPEIFGQLEFSQLELGVTEMQLYQDWNSGANAYGLVNIGNRSQP